MRLFYENTDITDSVQIREAVHRDCSGSRCDSLDITLTGAGKWYRWGPANNDRIEITDDGYRSGTFYVAAIVPQGDDFRILATAARTNAGEKKNDTYIGKSMDGIANLCAEECGMGYRIYGLNEKLVYPYLQRNEQTCAGVLHGIAEREGAVLKIYNGNFVLIGLEAAQALEAMETINITADSKSSEYERRDADKWRSLSIVTKYGTAYAVDTGARWGKQKILADLPAGDLATAKRWAIGLLRNHNRKAERLTIRTKLHTQWSACVRIDITGDTDANGQWVIDEAEHDLVRGTSRVELVRCVDTVE